MGLKGFFLLLISLFPLCMTFAVPTTFFPRVHYPLESLKQVAKLKPKIPYETRFYPQLLDHFTFTPKSSKRFYQKYLINEQYWRNGAPIFVYTGNEGDIEWFAANTGFLPDIAPQFHALLVFIEHRFYGESKPFGKDSYTSAETLGYLTSQQALADYAVLIRSLKQNLSSEASPVVVFGGSYGGNTNSFGEMEKAMEDFNNIIPFPILNSQHQNLIYSWVYLSVLAAWFRLKYPHITIGALASSAPILHFDNIVPKASFYDAVSQDFKDASLNCYEVIKGSWEELHQAFSKEGLAELSRTFRTCKNLHSVSSVQDWLWSAFVYTTMVNYPTEANFMRPLPAYPVQEMCKIIDAFAPETRKLDKVFAAASLYYNYSHGEKCFNLENGLDIHGLSGWNWQACTEMVMPMTCSNESMFPPSEFDFEEFATDCKKKYGVSPRPHWITTEFGGKRIEQVLKKFGSNIIFSNGMQDPWSRGGVLTNISTSIVAIVTKKGAHHVDFRSATKDDPDWLVEQRRQEVEIIHQWINEYYADMKQDKKFN